MIQARRIGHATFETPDLDRAIDYYTQVNGILCSPNARKTAPSSRARSGNSWSDLTAARARNAPGCRSKREPNSDFADMCRQLSDQGIANELSNGSDSGYRQSPEVQGPERHDHRAVLGMELSRASATRYSALGPSSSATSPSSSTTPER